MDREILLVEDSDVITELRTVAELITGSVYERIADYRFVNAYRNPSYYLSKSFPALFPYGRGCPSDEDTAIKDFNKHTRVMLLRGGGPQPRRFQKTPAYYFSMYMYEMRRRVGGVSCRAQNTFLDDNPIEIIDLAPTVGEINEVIDFFQRNNSQTIDNIIDDDSTPEAIRKLINRLVPYSKSLQGTKMHIMHERAKLMAMLPSPLITTDNTWRYFITFAPADVYDPRLYDITIDERMNQVVPSWDERMTTVKI